MQKRDTHRGGRVLKVVSFVAVAIGVGGVFYAIVVTPLGI